MYNFYWVCSVSFYSLHNTSGSTVRIRFIQSNENKYKKFRKPPTEPSDLASVTFDPGRLMLVGLLPLLAAGAGEWRAAAALVGGNALSSVQAGLRTHS